MKNRYLLLLLGTLSAYTAAHDDPCPSAVYLKSPKYRIDTQFRALALSPSANNIDYAAQATPLPIQSPRWNTYELIPGHHFGFDIGIQVQLHTRKTALGINWEHFSSNSTARHDVPVDTDMVGPFFEIGPDAQPYKKARGKVCFKFNTVNLTYGQWIHFGDHLDTNLFAGINATTIKECLTSVFSNKDNSIIRTISSPSSFTGAGPQVGCDFVYHVVKGLNFTGQLSGALIIGPVKNSTTYSSVSPELTLLNFASPNEQSTHTCKHSQVVPGISERLGIAYFFSACSTFVCKIEIGYEARVYINAIQAIDMASQVTGVKPVPDTAGVFARTFKKTVSNFALSGPYFALNIAF